LSVGRQPGEHRLPAILKRAVQDRGGAEGHDERKRVKGSRTSIVTRDAETVSQCKPSLE
jgi:hypothetical protein